MVNDAMMAMITLADLLEAIQTHVEGLPQVHAMAFAGRDLALAESIKLDTLDTAIRNAVGRPSTLLREVFDVQS